MSTAQQLRAEGQHQAESAADMRVVAMVDKVVADAVASKCCSICGVRL